MGDIEVAVWHQGVKKYWIADGLRSFAHLIAHDVDGSVEALLGVFHAYNAHAERADGDLDLLLPEISSIERSICN